MLNKLKRKFILVTMGIVLVMLAVIFGVLYTFTSADLNNQNQAALEKVSQAALQPGGLESLQKQIQQPYFVIRVDQFDGYSAAGYSYWDLSDEALLRSLVAKVNAIGYTNGTLRDMDLIYNVMVSRTVGVYVFLDVAGTAASMRALVQSSIAIGTVSMVAFFVLIFFLSRWMIRPVEKSWEQQKQFVSDASHELKTPLAVIMSNAELLQDPDVEQAQKDTFASSIFIKSLQMRSLVENLLELARADNGQVKKNFARLDLSGCVENTALPFEAMYFEKNLQLHTTIEPGIIVTGSESHLRQVTDILLDNAGKYATPGIVKLQLEKRGKKCLLSVSNPGSPIPQEDLENIFERFYRVDKARSSDGSFGLGLSIAKAIVEEHKGKIWAISNRTGSCFFVELPCE